MKHKSYRIVNGKPIWIIIDGNGKIINNKPSKEELKNLTKDEYKRIYNTTICENIKKDGTICNNKLVPGKRYKQKTGKWICKNCYMSCDYDKRPDSYNNIKKSIGNRRTNNQDPNHSNSKGDMFQELACREFGYIDLNKKYDNYNFPLDCMDIDGNRYQIKGTFVRFHGGTDQWSFSHLEKYWSIKYSNMICYCASSSRIDRIYIFPSNIVKNRKSIVISRGISNRGPYWYEKYRVTDDATLIRVNQIWEQILEEANGRC